MKNQYLRLLSVAGAVLGGLIIVALYPVSASACNNCGGGAAQSVQPINNTYTTTNTTYNTGDNVNNTNTNNNSTTNSNINTNNNTNSNNVSINIGGYAQAQAQQIYYQQPYYNQPVNTLICTPVSQNTGLNQTATVSASGGDGNYTWTVPEVGQTSYGASFQVSYATLGFHTITVRSAGQTATCSINVTGGQVLGTIDFPNTGAGGPDMLAYSELLTVLGIIALAILYVERRSRLN